MPHTPGPITKWTQYLAARAAASALLTFQPETNLRTAGLFGQLLHRFNKRHRERGITHLTMAFPDKSRDEIEQINAQMFEHFVRIIVEVMHTPRLVTPDNWPQTASIPDFSRPLEILNARRPAILLTGHVGNWEMLGTLMAVIGFKLNAIARPIDNPLINDWLLGIREKRGLKVITKWRATDVMLDVLDSGGILAFIADQNAGDKGLFVPFFGKLASTYKSIGLLAIQKNVPIICGCCHRVGTGYKYRMSVPDIIEPEDWAEKRDPLYYVTARYMRAIEGMVRLCPPQYLWMHRRWKSRPRFERLGKTMPAALRRNLDELPWMNDDLLHSLQQPAPVKK